MQEQFLPGSPPNLPAKIFAFPSYEYFRSPGLKQIDQNALFEIAQRIDHTLLKPEATPEAIRKLCQQARTYRFFSVCVQPVYVSLAAEELTGSGVTTCTVIGFPHGANTTETKVFEATQAIANGATELDMVINQGLVKSTAWDEVVHDIRAVVAASSPHAVKVILETTHLNAAEIAEACRAAQTAGAAFVKTSTGFGSGGASIRAVQLMRRTVGPNMGVKASGGIRTLTDYRAMVKAGANRIGASAGVAILQSLGAP